MLNKRLQVTMSNGLQWYTRAQPSFLPVHQCTEDLSIVFGGQAERKGARKNIKPEVMVVMEVVVKVVEGNGGKDSGDAGGGDVESLPRNTRLKVLCAVRRGVMEGRGGVFALRGRKKGNRGAGRRVLGAIWHYIRVAQPSPDGAAQL